MPRRAARRMSDEPTDDPTMSDSTATWPPRLPLVAILRGLQPERAADVGHMLFGLGFRALEVPLNRPGALRSIAALVPIAPADGWVGAGTVLEPAQVDAVGETGAALIVSPHFDAAVVHRARERGMRVVPGVFTASEAFAAWRAGADAPAPSLEPVAPAWPASVVTTPPGAIWRTVELPVSTT